jgi:hypothetical protein
VKDAVSAEERLRALLREVNGTIKDLQGERSKQLDALARGRQEVAALQATVDAIRQEISDIRDNPEVSLALVNSRRKVKSLIEETNAVQGRVSGMRKDLAVLQEEAREISQMSDLAGEASGFVVIDKRSGKVSIGIKAEPKLQGGTWATVPEGELWPAPSVIVQARFMRGGKPENVLQPSGRADRPDDVGTAVRGS